MSTTAPDGPAERLLTAGLDPGPRGGWQRTAILGMSKNAGKTVALNSLIRAAHRRGLPLALASTGRDGEEKDALTELPKPRIWVPAGAWLATVAGVVEAGSAQLHVVAELSEQTALGPVVIARVRRAGEAVLVGYGSRQRLATALAALEDRAGPGGLLLLDGSFDRLAAAAPQVTGQVVLAVGAAFSPTMARALTQVGHLVDVFGLPTPLAGVGAAWGEGAAAAVGPVAWIQAGRDQTLPCASAVGDAPVIAAMAVAQLEAGAGSAPDVEPTAGARQAAEASSGLLAITGAVSDRLVQELCQHPRWVPHIGLLVPDPTHIVVAAEHWRRFRRLGGQAFVQRPVRIAGLACNPHSPTSLCYDPQQWLAAVAQVAPHLLVVDLVAGLAAGPGKPYLPGAAADA